MHEANSHLLHGETAVRMLKRHCTAYITVQFKIKPQDGKWYLHTEACQPARPFQAASRLEQCHLREPALTSIGRSHDAVPALCQQPHQQRVLHLQCRA